MKSWALTVSDLNSEPPSLKCTVPPAAPAVSVSAPMPALSAWAIDVTMMSEVRASPRVTEAAVMCRSSSAEMLRSPVAPSPMVPAVERRKVNAAVPASRLPSRATSAAVIVVSAATVSVAPESTVNVPEPSTLWSASSVSGPVVACTLLEK